MTYPPLVKYENPDQYQRHYERVYCRGPITTCDNIQVRFHKNQFHHCFYESGHRDAVKDVFSALRAQRIDWIKAALQDCNAEMFVGWDAKKRRYVNDRRVAVVKDNYVVIIGLTGKTSAKFITAFVADSQSTIDRIRKGPKWQAQKNR